MGFHFIIHFFKRVWRINQRGKAEFIRAYGGEGLFPISAERRREMPAYFRCYQCRLCDTVCPELTTNPRLVPPSFLVGSFSRSLPDFACFEADYECKDCQVCEDICPQDIPIKAIIEFMKEGKRLVAA